MKKFIQNANFFKKQCMRDSLSVCEQSHDALKRVEAALLWRAGSFTCPKPPKRGFQVHADKDFQRRKALPDFVAGRGTCPPCQRADADDSSSRQPCRHLPLKMVNLGKRPKVRQSQSESSLIAVRKHCFHGAIR